MGGATQVGMHGGGCGGWAGIWTVLCVDVDVDVDVDVERKRAVENICWPCVPLGLLLVCAASLGVRKRLLCQDPQKFYRFAGAACFIPQLHVPYALLCAGVDARVLWAALRVGCLSA